jgi:hypothetical protein
MLPDNTNQVPSVGLPTNPQKNTKKILLLALIPAAVVLVPILIVLLIATGWLGQAPAGQFSGLSLSDGRVFNLFQGVCGVEPTDFDKLRDSVYIKHESRNDVEDDITQVGELGEDYVCRSDDRETYRTTIKEPTDEVTKHTRYIYTPSCQTLRLLAEEYSGRSSDVTLINRLERMGAKDFEGLLLTYTDSLSGLSDDFIQYGEYIPANECAATPTGIIAVIPSAPDYMLAHEYLHYVWGQKMNVYERLGLREKLMAQYESDSKLQGHLISGGYDPILIQNGTEQFAYYCTSYRDDELSADIIDICNQYINRQGFQIVGL